MRRCPLPPVPPGPITFRECTPFSKELYEQGAQGAGGKIGAKARGPWLTWTQRSATWLGVDEKGRRTEFPRGAAESGATG
jgi:hypothetical protein